MLHLVYFFSKPTLLYLHAFPDTDRAGNKDDRTSTSALIVYLGVNPILTWNKLLI